MSNSWSDYMKEHGTEEYAAWEAAVKPYTDRIAELEQRLQVSKELGQSLALAADERDGRISALEAENGALREERERIHKAAECYEGQENIAEHVSNLVVDHKDICKRLREAQQRHHLGLGGERLDVLVVDALDAATQRISALEAALATERAKYKDLDGHAKQARKDALKALGESASLRNQCEQAKVYIASLKAERDSLGKALATERERLDWLESRSFTAYRGRDPESGELYDHFTLVDEDRRPRTGIVKSTLRDCLNAARRSA